MALASTLRRRLRRYSWIRLPYFWFHRQLYLLRVLRQQWLWDLQATMDSRHVEKKWDFAEPVHQERNARIFAALARCYKEKREVHALEIGCSDGVFTGTLAPRCLSVVGCDISPVACTLAANRCADLPNVTVRQFDLHRDPIEDQYDWVFAMDVLYYVHGRDVLSRVVDKLAHALKQDGVLIVSDCRLPEPLRGGWWMHWYPEGADAIIEFMSGRSDLRLLHREFHPDNEGSIPGYLDHIIAIFSRSTA